MIFKPRLEVLIATRNAGKIIELQDALRELPITLRLLSEFPAVSPVEEVGETYQENAILKAIGYSSQTGICALADDSGLEVDALGGIPGVLSARFGGENASDGDRTEKLLNALTPYQDKQRAARFVCCMAFANGQMIDSEGRATEPQVLNVSEGTCEGLIALQQRGTRGFGYDPIFIPHGYAETFGELPEEVKSVMSHRAKALTAMRAFLSQFLTLT